MPDRNISRASAALLAPMLALALAGCATQHGGAGKGPPDPIAEETTFFRKNAEARNVVTLPGLQYMVLQSGPGSGQHPKRSDDVTVRYEGRFINGQVFDSSPRNGLDTTTFPLGRLIPGWVAALQMMRPGDVWMIYLPSNLAYGAPGKDPIPPYSTLVFRVELVSAAPHSDKPAEAAQEAH
jgi:FKBP-type peptidyl-prolyl cis-trans isomerase FklB